jgi:restriction system protein
MYDIEIRHAGLGAYRHIRGSDHAIVMQKAEAQQRAWEERWQKLKRKEEATNNKLAKKEQAEARSAAASAALSSIDDTLRSAVTSNNPFDWDALKDRTSFPVPEPIPTPLEPTPLKPSPNEDRFQPKLGMLDRIFKSHRMMREAEAVQSYQWEHAQWQKARDELAKLNKERKREHLRQMKIWKNQKQRFLETQNTRMKGSMKDAGTI